MLDQLDVLFKKSRLVSYRCYFLERLSRDRETPASSGWAYGGAQDNLTAACCQKRLLSSMKRSPQKLGDVFRKGRSHGICKVKVRSKRGNGYADGFPARS